MQRKKLAGALVATITGSVTLVPLLVQLQAADATPGGSRSSSRSRSVSPHHRPGSEVKDAIGPTERLKPDLAATRITTGSPEVRVFQVEGSSASGDEVTLRITTHTPRRGRALLWEYNKDTGGERGRQVDLEEVAGHLKSMPDSVRVTPLDPNASDGETSEEE
jgi:hypothetical protein